MNNSEPQTLLKVGDIAAEAGVGVQTLHYYERLGLLPKPQRSAANHRVYCPEILRRVQFIKKAQALGFTLEEIKELFRSQQKDASRCHHVAELAENRLHQLDAELKMLQEFRAALSAALPNWKRQLSARCKCAGEFCDLIEKVNATPSPAARLKKLKQSP